MEVERRLALKWRGGWRWSWSWIWCKSQVVDWEMAMKRWTERVTQRLYLLVDVSLNEYG